MLTAIAESSGDRQSDEDEEYDDDYDELIDVSKPGKAGSASSVTFVMVALCNRADHIYFHAVVCSSFFPRLISAAADWMSTILPHMVWP